MSIETPVRSGNLFFAGVISAKSGAGLIEMLGMIDDRNGEHGGFRRTI
jgi:hypothetical protein